MRAIHHIRPLRADDSGIIRFNFHKYKGPTKVLDNGSKVEAGDTIMEVHLNNDWFRKRRELELSAAQSPREFLGRFAEDLRFLAQQMDSGKFDDVTALHGDTILHVAARRLGFEIKELPNSLWNRGARFYMAGLMQVYHLRGGRVSGLKEKTWELKEIWLSRAALLSKYGSERL